MTTGHDNNATIVYWHRDLPPLDAELVAEHIVEASSRRVLGTLAHRDELWDQCYQELMTNTTNRLVEDVACVPLIPGIRQKSLPIPEPNRAVAWSRGFRDPRGYRRPS